MDGFLSYALIFLIGWASFVDVGIAGNMLRARRNHNRLRKSDLVQLITLTCAIAVSIVASLSPDIFSNYSSTVAALELGSIPFLLYLSEKHVKDWVNLCKILHSIP